MRKVFMIGDSLMQDYNALSYPQFGFGQMIKPFILDDVMFLNLSKAGRSTKSFIDQKRFDDILKIIEEGDLLIVEFGNNDEKVDDLSRYTDKDTTFLSNLNYFYTSAKEKGADCIFITSPTRNEFDEQGHIIDTHKGYPKAMYDWCQKNNYLCYELNEESKRIYNFLGSKEVNKLHQIYEKGIYKRYPDGLNDKSHYNFKGATFIASLIINFLENNYKDFDKYFIKLEDATSYNPNLKIDLINLLKMNSIIK